MLFIADYNTVEPKVIYKVVNAPPTDQQLIDFWFGGNQDQAALRKRICK